MLQIRDNPIRNCQRHQFPKAKSQFVFRLQYVLYIFIMVNSKHADGVERNNDLYLVPARDKAEEI